MKGGYTQKEDTELVRAGLFFGGARGGGGGVEKEVFTFAEAHRKVWRGSVHTRLAFGGEK